MNQETLQKPHISIAPMMDWTDRHFRTMMRFISPHVYLYTEMVTTGALIHGDRARFLRYSECEHPIALQLGGSNPEDLARCAQMGQEAGYDEINLNCGCPSDRVQSGRFGGCLMKEPDHVAACAAAMMREIDIPVTLKCRIGIDEQDDFDFLDRFVDKSADKGVRTFIIHARKAWLKGLSPKENRSVPPINYERVHEIKKKYPELNIVVNGEIKTLNQVQEHLKTFDGVMIGREAYNNPYLFAEIEREIWGYTETPAREEIARAMIPYAKAQAELYGTPVKSITRHMMGLYQGMPGAKNYRRVLIPPPSEETSGPEVIEEALNALGNRYKLVS